MKSDHGDFKNILTKVADFITITHKVSLQDRFYSNLHNHILLRTLFLIRWLTNMTLAKI